MRLQIVLAFVSFSLSILNLPKAVNQVDQFLVVVLRLKDVNDILHL